MEPQEICCDNVDGFTGTSGGLLSTLQHFNLPTLSLTAFRAMQFKRPARAPHMGLQYAKR